ncbi:MAG: hypothetical protein M9894_15200 [Planctomycetes bacterium]|nr:hypothetical protein [Planctomycetota bacterium]
MTKMISRALPATAVALLLAGCAMIGAPPERAPDHDAAPAAPSDAPIVADCHVVELDALSAEVEEPRERAFDGVRFRYAGSPAVVEALAAAAPQQVFVIAHGWMNDVQSGREFTGRLVKGIAERARRDGVDASRLGFVAVHWDSKRLVFHESALNAEVIGSRRVAPLLARLGERVPGAKVVLVGHSLGGRLVLSALNAEGPATQVRAHAAVLLEAAVDQDALLPERGGSLIGGFPMAPGRTPLLLNVHSRQDDVLELAYKNAMRRPALGREGADRAIGGERYARLELRAEPFDPIRLDGILTDPQSRWPGAPDRHVVNVDATAVVTGHSEVFIQPVFDLVWLAAARGGTGGGRGKTD